MTRSIVASTDLHNSFSGTLMFLQDIHEVFEVVEVRLDFEVEVEVRLLDLFVVVFLQILVVVSCSFV